MQTRVCFSDEDLTLTFNVGALPILKMSFTRVSK